MNKFRIVQELSKICEYTYRKGVFDSGRIGDPTEIKEVSERDDNYQTYQFVEDEQFHESKFSLYADKIIVIANELKCPNWRSFMLFKAGEPRLKKDMLTLIDFYYRLGLNDGLLVSEDVATELFESIKFGNSHQKATSNRKIVKREFIDEMKAKSNEINAHKLNNGIKTLQYSQLSKFIEEGRSK